MSNEKNQQLHKEVKQQEREYFKQKHSDDDKNKSTSTKHKS